MVSQSRQPSGQPYNVAVSKLTREAKFQLHMLVGPVDGSERIMKWSAQLWFVLSVGVLSVTQALVAQLPTVEILYPPGGSLLDRLCKSDLKLQVDDKALQAAVQQRRELQKQWDAEGPSYL